MTQITLTSGQVLDVISSLTDRGNNAFDSQEYHLADYYFKIAFQFRKVFEKLQDLVPEERVAAAFRVILDEVIPEYREHHPHTRDEKLRNISAYFTREKFLQIIYQLENEV